MAKARAAVTEADVARVIRAARRVGATEAGASIHELNAIFGWTGSQMASHYTEEANRRKLARGAINKLQRGENGC